VNENAEKNQFAQQFMLMLGDYRMFIAAEYDEEAFACHLNLGGGNSIRVYLGNAYENAQSAKDSDSKKKILRDFVDQLVTTAKGASVQLASTTILPVLRSAASTFCANAEALASNSAQGQTGDFMLHRPLAGDVDIWLVLNGERTVTTVGTFHLERLGLSDKDAWENAMENLAKLPPERWLQGYGRKQGMHLLVGDLFATARMLLPDFASELCLKGDPVVIVRSRTQLIVTGSEDSQGLASIARAASENVEEGPEISVTPLCRRAGGRWEVFTISTPNAHELRDTQSHFDIAAFESQAKAIEKWLKPVEAIGSFGSVKSPTGNALSTCAVWPAEGAALLPRTEYIVLSTQDNAPPQLVRWSTVEAMAPELLSDPGYRPTWRRVVGPMAEETKERLLEFDATRH